MEILPNDLVQSHHIGNPKRRKKERPTIVKFVRYNLRHTIFKIKTCHKEKVFHLQKVPQKNVWPN